MVDLEQVLDRYDPGTVIFVSPLLRLSISKYRYFFVAGQASRICESVAIGFVESEDEAQTKYADVLAKLQGQFAGLTTFGTRVDMAQAVHARWPNEETATFLANAEFAANAELAAEEPATLWADSKFAPEMPTSQLGRDRRDQSNLPRVEESTLSIAAIAPALNASEQEAGLAPMDSPPGATEYGSQEFLQALRLQIRRSPGTQRPVSDEIAMPSHQSGELALPEKGDATLSLMSMRRTPALLWRRIGILGCAAVVAAIIVVPLTRYATRSTPPVPTPLIASQGPLDGPSTAARLPSTTAEDPTTSQALQGPPPAQVSPSSIKPKSNPSSNTTVISPFAGTSTLTSEPAIQSRTEPVHDAAVVSSASKQSLPRQSSSPSITSADGLRNTPEVHRLGADEIAMLLERGIFLLTSGDVASARLVLRRAAEAGSANAALKLGETFDPKFLESIGALGVMPDVGMAREWYEKAAALGSEPAARRIAELTIR